MIERTKKNIRDDIRRVLEDSLWEAFLKKNKTEFTRCLHSLMANTILMYEDTKKRMGMDLAEVPEQGFDHEAASATVLLILTLLGETTRVRLLALIYLADRTHLGDYGRYITGEEYRNHEQGPVPQFTYGVLQFLEKGVFYRCHSFVMEKILRPRIRVSGNRVSLVSSNEVDFDYLSESDMKCIKEVVKRYGRVHPLDLRREIKDEAWEDTELGDLIPRVKVAETLDSHELLEYLIWQHT